MAIERYTQLFFDRGNGYNEEDSIRQTIEYGAVKLNFELREFKGILKLRLDPVNTKCLISNLKVTSITSSGSNNVSLGNSNAEYIDQNGNIIFLNDDPNIHISVDANEWINNIEVEFNFGDDIMIIENLSELLSQTQGKSSLDHVDQLKELTKNINGKLTNLMGDISYQKSFIGKNGKKLSEIITSIEQSEKSLTALTTAVQKTSDNGLSKLEKKLNTEIQSLVKAKSLHEQLIKNFIKEQTQHNSKALKDYSLHLDKYIKELSKSTQSSDSKMKNHLLQLEKFQETSSKKIESIISTRNKQDSYVTKNIDELKKHHMDNKSELKSITSLLHKIEQLQDNSNTQFHKENSKLTRKVVTLEKKTKAYKKDIENLTEQVNKLSEENLLLQSISEQYNLLLEELELLSKNNA